MKPVKESKKYAKMFISIIGLEEAPKALGELAVIESLMIKSSEFRSMLLNPAFSQGEKENALKKVVDRAGLSGRTVKFVMHLVEKQVIGGLSEILKIATALYLEKKKRAKATVLTSVELSDSHVQRLKDSLKKLIEKDVEVDFVLDPSLLGGVLVKVGSTMYDSSIKGQLRLLKDELIKG